MKSNWMFVSTYEIIAYFTLLYDTQLLPRPREYIDIRSQPMMNG